MRGQLTFVCAFVVIVVAFRGAKADAVLYDVIFYDDATVRSGEYYTSVTVHDSPPESTTIEFYGRGDALFTYDSSSVNVHDGGSFGENWGTYESELFDSSIVNVYQGGGFYGGSASRLDLYESSTLNVDEGVIWSFLFLHDCSTVNLYGALFLGFGLFDTSTLNIYGGYISTFFGNSWAEPTATVNIYGSALDYEPKARWGYLDDPADGWWISKLTGHTLDGEPFTYWGIPDPSTNPNVNLIPEPGSIFLLGMGSLVLLRKRTHV